MKYYTAEDIGDFLDFTSLIESLKIGFTKHYTIPTRMHINYDNAVDNNQNTMLLMPAIESDGYAGVKIVNVSPANNSRNMPTIRGIYYMVDAINGEPKALMDAKSLTNWRTAAASALAATYLASPTASCLLMVGTGSLSPYIIDAYTAIRPIEKLMIYGRNKSKAEALAQQKTSLVKEIIVVENLPDAVPQADIISVATLSEKPLILGSWLRPGQHLDLIGSYRTDMREADNEALTRSKIYVDSIKSAPNESGDLFIPLRDGIISLDDIKGDLFQLCGNKVQGRVDENEITVFKSVGHSLEDLVAAKLILDNETSKLSPKT